VPCSRNFALNYASQNDSLPAVAAWSSIINEKNDEVALLERFDVACTTVACLERLTEIKNPQFRQRFKLWTTSVRSKRATEPIGTFDHKL